MTISQRTFRLSGITDSDRFQMRLGSVSSRVTAFPTFGRAAILLKSGKSGEFSAKTPCGNSLRMLQKDSIKARWFSLLFAFLRLHIQQKQTCSFRSKVTILGKGSPRRKERMLVMDRCENTRQNGWKGIWIDWRKSEIDLCA